jgi:hypothetical protein
MPARYRRGRQNRLLFPIYLFLLAIVVLSVAACGGAKPPASGQVTPPPAPPPPPPDPSRPTLTAAAAALEKKDAEAFALTLSAPLRETVAEHLDLSGPGAAVLAKAIKEARLVAEYAQVRIYEVVVDGETHTFMAVKEGDQWLLAGL